MADYIVIVVLLIIGALLLIAAIKPSLFKSRKTSIESEIVESFLPQDENKTSDDRSSVKANILVPERFDLSRIQKDLTKYRFDQNALSMYMSGMVDRFKSGEQRKQIGELMRYLGLAKEYSDHLYEVAQSQIKLSMLDLERQKSELGHEYDIEKTRTGIVGEKAKQKEFEDIIHGKAASSSDSSEREQAERLKKDKQEANYEYESERYRDQLRRKLIREKSEEKLAELELLIKTYEASKKGINSSVELSDTDKQEALRTLEKTFLKHLQDFERGLDL